MKFQPAVHHPEIHLFAIAIIVFVLLCARVSIGAICETLLAAALRMFYYRSSSLFLDLIKLDHGQTDPTINALDVRKTKS